MVKINKLILDHLDSQLIAYDATSIEALEAVAEEAKLNYGVDFEYNIEEWANEAMVAINQQVDEMRAYLLTLRDKTIDETTGKNIEIDLINKEINMGYSRTLTGRVLPFYNDFSYDGLIKKEVHFDSEDLCFENADEPINA